MLRSSLKAVLIIVLAYWGYSQRRKQAWMLYCLIKNFTLGNIKSLIGLRLQPSVKEEIFVPFLRDVLLNVDLPYFTKSIEALANLHPKKYLLRPVQQKGFKGYFYGNHHPDAKILLYIHGGGYCFGHACMYLPAFDILLTLLKQKGVECNILTVEYSLSPGAAFPKALNEVVAAYQYLLNDLCISPKKILVGGDSAGGALTLAFTCQIRESLLPPAGLILFSPWVDSRNNDRHLQSPSLQYDYLHPQLLNYCITRYLQGQPQTHLSSPILGDTTGFPPCLVCYGEREILKDDILVFIGKLKSENPDGKIEVVSHPEGVHDYPLDPPNYGQKALEALDKVANLIQYC
jgi:acetyl esterase/lipase